jgi:5-(carboxyamino)imidazole ribonucleotide synthase
MKVGVLGGGQLGRMLALAGYPLGLQFRFLDPSLDAPAAHLAEHIVGGYEDPALLDRFASGLDLITYEFENVPVATARHLAERVPIYPPPGALEVSQDRLTEKTFFNSLGIPTPRFAAVDSLEALQQACEVIGLPAVLKTRRMGYDGKGQNVLKEPGDIAAAWEALGGQPLILEGFVSFRRELSILAVRSTKGEQRCYPLVENQHVDGILRLSRAPAPGLTSGLEEKARDYAYRVLDALNYVGVLAIELFEVGDELLANEMAPRVHNSGHWTIEGAETSQFENHLRAIIGMPLGLPACVSRSAMLNIIGKIPDVEQVLAVPGAHLHLYGKEPRLGRKLGHVTILEDANGPYEERLVRLGVLVG